MRCLTTNDVIFQVGERKLLSSVDHVGKDKETEFKIRMEISRFSKFDIDNVDACSTTNSATRNDTHRSSHTTFLKLVSVNFESSVTLF